MDSLLVTNPFVGAFPSLAIICGQNRSDGDAGHLKNGATTPERRYVEGWKTQVEKAHPACQLLRYSREH